MPRKRKIPTPPTTPLQKRQRHHGSDSQRVTQSDPISEPTSPLPVPRMRRVTKGVARTTLTLGLHSNQAPKASAVSSKSKSSSRRTTNAKNIPIRGFLGRASASRSTVLRLQPAKEDDSLTRQSTSRDDVSDDNDEHYMMNSDPMPSYYDDAVEVALEREQGTLPLPTRVRIAPTLYIPRVPLVAAPRHNQSRISKALSWSSQTLPRLVWAYLDCAAQTNQGLSTTLHEPPCTCGIAPKTTLVRAIRQTGKPPINIHTFCLCMTLTHVRM